MLSNQHYLIPIQKIEQELGIISEMYTNLKKECECLTLKKLELQKLNSLALTEYINDAKGP